MNVNKIKTSMNVLLLMVVTPSSPQRSPHQVRAIHPHGGDGPGGGGGHGARHGAAARPHLRAAGEAQRMRTDPRAAVRC